MNHTQSLPEPSTDALLHSQKLIAQICEEIDNNGSITFRRYMEMALYQPGLGYYVAGTHKIGAQGDFITAPEISSLYSQCITNQCIDVLQETKGDILELGAGSGIMAVDILLELDKQNCLPNNYYILDLSPDLKQRQNETLHQHLQEKAPHLIKSVKWLSQLPDRFNGMILGNEILDAMPVDIFTQQGNTVYEHHVIYEDSGDRQKLVEQLKPATEKLHDKVLKLDIPNEATPYTSEINPNLDGWFKTLSKSLQKGIVLLIDYGYPQSEYYLPERNKGTLICHYQHLVNDSPLTYPGLQDITANVDFTAVAIAADNAGLSVNGFTSQAAFIANSGLETLFIRALEINPDNQYKLAQQVRTLSLPSEMGERFKFIALSKNYNNKLKGFSAMNQLHRL